MALIVDSPAASLLLAAMVLASLAGLLAAPGTVERNLSPPYWLFRQREYATPVSSAGTYFKHRHEPGYRCLGASGAILAVLFAAIVYAPTSSIPILPIPVPIPALLFALAYLAYSYYAARRQARGRVNHDAHLAGALAGVAFVVLTDAAAVARVWRLVLG